MSVVVLRESGVGRVLNGRAGMTFAVDSFTDTADGRVAYVRDYRYGDGPRGEETFQVWGLGAEDYDLLPDPATDAVDHLCDIIEGLIDAPAFQDAETLVGDDVRALELAKAAVAKARADYPVLYVPTPKAIALVMDLLAAAVEAAGPAGAPVEGLFLDFSRHGGSRELFEAMMKTLQSGGRVRRFRDRYVAPGILKEK